MTTETISIADLESRLNDTGFGYSKAMNAKEKPLREVVSLEQAIKTAQECPWTALDKMLEEFEQGVPTIMLPNAPQKWDAIRTFVSNRKRLIGADLLESSLTTAREQLTLERRRFEQASKELDRAKQAHEQAKAALQAAREEGA